MAFNVHAQRLLAGQHHFDRLAGLQGAQGQVLLQDHVFLGPEGPAGRDLDHPDFTLRHIQDLRQLGAVVKGRLGADLEH